MSKRKTKRGPQIAWRNGRTHVILNHRIIATYIGKLTLQDHYHHTARIAERRILAMEQGS